MAASAYGDSAVDPSGTLTAADIKTVFREPAGRLSRDRVRNCFYAKGFPIPLNVGCGSPRLTDWPASAGGVEHGRHTSQGVRQVSLLVLSMDRSRAALKRWPA